MRASKVAVVCAALAVVAVTGGCGGSAKSSSSPASSPATAATAANTTPSDAPESRTATSGAPAGRGITKPGAQLAVGQTATVPFKDPGDTSSSPDPFRLAVTVLSISKGSLSDFNGIQLDANQKASTPYYVHFKVTNVGRGDLGSSTDAVLQGIDDTGQEQQSVTFIGSFPPCDDVSPPKPFGPGNTWTTCQVFMVPGGITAVEYAGGGDEKYLESPVRWK